MSTVRMSRYLMDEIISEFHNSFNKANPALEDNPKYGDLVYNAHIAPKINNVLEVANRELGELCDPSTMFTRESQIKFIAPVTKYSVDDDKVEGQLIEEMPITASLSTERLFPASVPRTQYHSITPAVFTFNRHEDPNVEYICACVEYNSELNAKREVASRKVKTLLNNFTTLNQALKAWPALSKLVKAEALAKVHTKQERKRKQELQKEIADDLVASADLNKTILAGALIGDDD